MIFRYHISLLFISFIFSNALIAELPNQPLPVTKPASFLSSGEANVRNHLTRIILIEYLMKNSKMSVGQDLSGLLKKSKNIKESLPNMVSSCRVEIVQRAAIEKYSNIRAYEPIDATKASSYYTDILQNLTGKK